MRASCGYLRIPPTSDFVGGTSVCHLILVTLSSNPIGRQIHGWGEWFTVIGVAGNSKYHYLSEAPLPYFYVSFRQMYRADLDLAFYVRTQGNPETALSLVRQKAREIDPAVTVFDSVPLSEFIGASLYPQRLRPAC